MESTAVGTSFQSSAASGGRGDVLARLPLQVGTTSHWSFTRVPIPVGVAIALAIAIPQLATSGEVDQTEDVVGLVVLGVVAITCLAYSVFHLRGAMAMRASDIILTRRGIEIEGGARAGMRVSWQELSEPYAEVEETNERQLSALGAILFAATLFRAGTPLTRVAVWKLWIHAGGQKKLAAKCDREVEAQSMEAAAASVASVKEGRREVAEAPTVDVRGLFCTNCGAPVTPRDAPEVDCGYCGSPVPLDAEARKQAAATAQLQESKKRASKITSKLLQQPRAAPTNSWLWMLWMVMLLPWLPTLILFFYLRATGAELAWFEIEPWALWAAPPLVIFGAWALGRARLVSRGAFQLLTLGFGALAPARDGEPPRCRRCHGPLDEAGPGGVVSCGFCEADNIAGIDPRPFVDKARAEEQTMDRVLEDRRRSRRAYLLVAALGVFGLAGAVVLLLSAVAAI